MKQSDEHVGLLVIGVIIAITLAVIAIEGIFGYMVRGYGYSAYGMPYYGGMMGGMMGAGGAPYSSGGSSWNGMMSFYPNETNYGHNTTIQNSTYQSYWRYMLQQMT